MGNFKIRSILNTAIFLFLFFSISAFAQENRGIKLHSDRYALVIGNSDYQTSPLNNTGNDADDMNDSLKSLGFKVILRKNSGQRNMEDAIRIFGKQLKDGGVGLFYFAGHGMQVEGRNYLIPIDAKIDSESDVKYEAVDAGRVLGKMEDAGNRLNIVILDSCRNNPFARAFGTDQRGLARMDAPAGSLIAYATSPGEVAADGTERNGIFTKYLIKHMATQNLPIEQVLKRVRIDVASETNGRQIPWESSSLMGDFYFSAVISAAIERPTSISSASEDQKKTIAAKPATKEKFDSRDSRLKITILPMCADYSSKVNSYGSTTDIINAGIGSLRHVLQTNKRLVPAYSFYDLGEKSKPIMLQRFINADKLKEDLWIKKNFWSEKELNADAIYELKNKIQIDFAVTYRFKSDGLNWDSILYIIDIKNRNIYSKNDTFAIYSLHPSLKRFAEKVFSDYERATLKR